MDKETQYLVMFLDKLLQDNPLCISERLPALVAKKSEQLSTILSKPFVLQMDDIDHIRNRLVIFFTTEHFSSVVQLDLNRLFTIKSDEELSDYVDYLIVDVLSRYIQFTLKDNHDQFTNQKA